MTTLRINLKDFGRALGAIGKIITYRQTQAMRKMANDAVKHARRVASSYHPKPVATGKYMAAWRAQHYAHHSAVVNTSPHSVYVEKGRRAGAPMPPLEPIRKWMKIKRIDPSAAYPIARSIARRGIKARPVLPSLRRYLLSAYGEWMKVALMKSIEAGIRSKGGV